MTFLFALAVIGILIIPNASAGVTLLSPTISKVTVFPITSYKTTIIPSSQFINTVPTDSFQTPKLQPVVMPTSTPISSITQNITRDQAIEIAINQFPPMHLSEPPSAVLKNGYPGWTVPNEYSGLPRWMWVVTLTGGYLDNEKLLGRQGGGRVWIDAKTGAVLHSSPYY